MKRGDFLLVRPGPGIRTEIGTRYWSGLVLSAQSNFNVIMVAWHDGMVHLEDVSLIEKYYIVIGVDD